MEIQIIKNARRCGAKHFSMPRILETDRLGALFEVELSKKCTPLWREAHFEVKMYKHTMLGALLEVENDEKVHAVVAQSTF